MGSFLSRVHDISIKVVLYIDIKIVFYFQFKLCDIEEVSLLTKKGYLTVALSHAKDGRVLLRRHEGTREWFNMIKVTGQ